MTKLLKGVNIRSEQKPAIQKTIPQIKTLNSLLAYPYFKVNNINKIKQHLEEIVQLSLVLNGQH